MKVIKNRYTYYTISISLFLLSIFMLFGTKLNLGIDMTGGIQMEYNYKNINIEEVKNLVNEKSKEILYNNKSIINSTSVYKITGEDKIGILIGFDSSINEKELEVIKNNFRMDILGLLKNLDNEIIENSYINIGKSFGDYIKNTAIITLLIAIIAIAIYVTWAFSAIASGISMLSFSSITIITLFHDVIISSGIYILISIFYPQFQIDTFFITALLTILGYSINDTIVVFDRIRSNLKQIGKKKNDLGDIIDKSISETLTRSTFTSLTVLFVLIAIFFFGPEVIGGFTLVMILGTIVGTYSSIFIASPILYEINKKKKLEIIKEQIHNIEDKIVV